MVLKDFVGKEVFSTSTKEHHIIDKLDGVGIYVGTVKQNKYGTYSHFVCKTGTAPYDNAIVRGSLAFEDKTLFEPFKKFTKNINTRKEDLTHIFII